MVSGKLENTLYKLVDVPNILRGIAKTYIWFSIVMYAKIKIERDELKKNLSVFSEISRKYKVYRLC